VADVALGLRVLAGPDVRDPFSLPPLGEGELDLEGELTGLRVGWSPSPTGAPVEAEVVEAARQTLARLEPLGIRVTPVTSTVPIPTRALGDMLAGDSMLVFVLAGMASPWRAFLLRILGWFSARYRLSPSFAPMARRGFHTSLARYVAAQKELTDFVEKPLAGLFEGIDVLATPTIALPPFPHPGVGELGPEKVAGEAIDRHMGWLFTWPFNLTGQPAVSIPCGWTADGLPLGLQLVGRRCQDGLVLRLAAAVERVQPWAGRRPGGPVA
jgi:Asp-tRNA(Asn)/Glu-tRNA(Gln) amidotransferase A subunit family amidase